MRGAAPGAGAGFSQVGRPSKVREAEPESIWGVPAALPLEPQNIQTTGAPACVGDPQPAPLPGYHVPQSQQASAVPSNFQPWVRASCSPQKASACGDKPFGPLVPVVSSDSTSGAGGGGGGHLPLRGGQNNRHRHGGGHGRSARGETHRSGFEAGAGLRFILSWCPNRLKCFPKQEKCGQRRGAQAQGPRGVAEGPAGRG